MATFSDTNDASATIAWVLGRLQTKLDEPVATRGGEPVFDQCKQRVALTVPPFDDVDAQALIDAQP